MKLPRLRRDQYRIATHPARIKVVAMGRRWGKTLMAGSMALAEAFKGGQVAWVVPTYRNARALWRFIETHAAGRAQLRRSEMQAQFGRGHVTIYTADNDVSMRGESFDLVIIDEAAQVREETWTDVIMPTLADRDGKAVLISTPKGRNWFWREFQRGRNDGQRQASFHAPSASNPMPTIRKAAEMARDRVSERTYRQEWLAEFVEDGGGVFRGVRTRAVSTPLAHGAEGREYVVGVDWGRTNDATVFVVLDIASREMVHIERMTDTDYRLQISRLVALAERFGNPYIVAELNSMGGPQVEAAQTMGLRVEGLTTSNATKAAWVDALALAFERGTISILPDETLITELESFESSRLPSGLVRYAAPAGMHDDCVMALALAYTAVQDDQPLVLFGG